MGTAAVKIKIMPESPDSNLEEIKARAREIIEKEGGKNLKFSEEAIAFGLKAIIAFFAWNESNDSEILEKEIAKINEVSSAQTTDIRRAFG